MKEDTNENSDSEVDEGINLNNVEFEEELDYGMHRDASDDEPEGDEEEADDAEDGDEEDDDRDFGYADL